MSRKITLEVSREHGAYQLSINEVDADGDGAGRPVHGRPRMSRG